MRTSAHRRSDSGRIIFLDYLRIFAFVSVLIFHKFFVYATAFVGDTSIHATPRLILRSISPLFEFGGAGVVVFFLVSGYIVTHVLQSEQPFEFAVKRIFRIYPLYIVAILLQILFSGVVPSPSIMITRILLIGDFFGTPYALADVDWTLRIEVMFYLFMVVLRHLGVIQSPRVWLAWILVITTVILDTIPPIPSGNNLFTGSFTIYGPFLFLGVFFYLRETQRISLGFLLAFVGLVLFHYYRLIARDEPEVMGSHFAALGLLIFTLAWGFRSQLIITSVVRFASELTYAVYLFHNWIWDYLRSFLSAHSVAILPPDLQALLALLLICVLVSRGVERPCIRLGHMLLARRRAHQQVL